MGFPEDAAVMTGVKPGTGEKTCKAGKKPRFRPVKSTATLGESKTFRSHNGFLGVLRFAARRVLHDFADILRPQPGDPGFPHMPNSQALPPTGAAHVCRRASLLLAGLVCWGYLPAQFTDRAQTAGVDLNYPTVVGGHSLPRLDPYSVGGAACAADIDGDGWTDLIVTQAGAPCLVFMNNRDGTFREEARQRGLDAAVDIGGIAAGDLQNHGVQDIVMVPVAGDRHYLFVNDGTGHFTEHAADRGVAVPVSVEQHLGQSISLVDYDRDGYLDIHIAEWFVPSNAENQLHSVLLHNRGATAPGYFENKTAASGLTQPATGNLTANYAMAWADYDGDGYPDVFIAGDFGLSQFWWNNGDGTFTNGTTTSGIMNSADGMGVTLLDYDGDGKVDIFVSAISLTNQSSASDKGYISDNKLFRNLGGRRFFETSDAVGVKESGWGWGAQTLDANNDGWPDLAVTNGYIGPGASFAPAKTDPTKLLINNGGTFSDGSFVYGITDTGLGRSVVILDYDNDGREDIFITQTDSHRLLYRNVGASAAHWLNLKFVGHTSNRDGYGCEVTVTAGGRSQTAIYNPTNAYIGQREARLHFGLGANTTVTTIRIKWPSGVVQEFTDVAADQLFTVNEATNPAAAPSVVTSPANVTAAKDGRAVLSVTGQGFPAPVYVWYKDGVRVSGQSGATLVIAHVQPVDAGTYTVELVNQFGTATSLGGTLTVTADLGSKSVARWWNEALLDGIRKDTPNPPVHARNLFHVSAALWDSFWAYERDGWTNRHEAYSKEMVTLPADEAARLAAQREAMSYAAYTVIKARFALSPGSKPTLAGLRWLMQQYGFNPDPTDNTGATPSAVGLRIGQAVLTRTLQDGANEAGGYSDATGYIATNPPLRVRNPGVGTGVNPDRWQPLDLVNTITQNGIVLGPNVQRFIGSNARNTATFSLRHAANGFLVDDPGPPPQFGGSTKARYIDETREVLAYSSQLTTVDGVTIDISPGKLLNNTLGANDGRGHATNPSTGQAYASNVVLRGDYARVLAEFWADGPSSETPPGHWNVIFNEVSDHPQATRRLLGQGSALPRLKWDVCGYFALNTAVHDAACAAWTLKWQYDGARPITMIRYLAALGQSSDPAQPSYHADGLPLVTGQIELITEQSAAAGQRHAHLANAVGKIAVKSWLGTPANPTLTSGVGWILGENWMPYQQETFVTPAFPGYISGHSTFSAAAAVALTRLTGAAFFPGGMFLHDISAGTGLGFEAGPSTNIQLQWATYFDAADQAGLSRLFGGIHVSSDDFIGRRVGAKVGEDAFNDFLVFYDTAGTTTTAAQRPTPGSPNAAPPAVVTPAPTAPAAPLSGGSRGGGAPSVFFLGALALLAVARHGKCRRT
jgi:hypothetical protein